ncbi:class I SAM-dependent methyltransferase [Streptomyces griseoviridis]|uniref:SAM-dependent methyltransferase n=2 Tax=Streptomyces griseoviridis TaxID=45398 RepID=A0A3Q9KLY6_STRGD|nr:class I SAM-dependent methyltransferase [Streptomyces griseoviridis]QCN89485.1 SAM-dependent methyltransferase [Streptomyces griseoviridis]
MRKVSLNSPASELNPPEPEGNAPDGRRAVIDTEYEREVARMYDEKQNDFNLLLGKETNLVHHHFGIGDFDRSPGALQDESAIQRRLHELENAQTERLLDLLDGLGPEHRIFDGGSGRGGTAFMAHERLGCSVDGATISQYQRGFAERSAHERGCADKVRFHFMNMLRTGLPTATVDAALTNEVTMYVSDLTALFREFARIVKPGGRYVFATWAVDESGSGDEIISAIDRHYACTMHTRGAYLRALLESGFVPYHVAQMDEDALPYWELRGRSEHSDTIEKLFIDGYDTSTIAYLMVAAERIGP